MNLPAVYVYILVMLTLQTGECRIVRRKRIVTSIDKFAIEELMSFGIDALVDPITETGNTEKLDSVLKILSSIQVQNKELQTIRDAEGFERDLLAFNEHLDTFIKSYKTCLLANTTNNCDQTLENEKEALKMDLMKIPKLLTELHLVIEGVREVSQKAGERRTVRRKRIVPIVTAIAKFAIKELMSFGIDALVDHITETGNTEKLDSILKILSSIQVQNKDLLIKIKELKELQTIRDAERVERDLLAIYEHLDTFIKSYKTCLLANTTNNCNQTLENEKEALKMDLMKIPNLLTELHLVIEGASVVSAGRTSGLACDYVGHVLRELQAATSQRYNLKQSLSDISSYKEELMKLQVSSFQLYNLTCSANSPTCAVERDKLEGRLKDQEGRFKRCTPQYFSQLRNINIIHPNSGTVLFTNQKGSIVTDGTFDTDRINKPLDAGLRCPRKDCSEVFSWENASSDGRPGFYLRQKCGCYLSFDRPFLSYEQRVPTLWTKSDKIDRKEFLICEPSKHDALTFLITAAEADIDTTYSFKEVQTGKYLNIHTKKTSVYNAIDKRLNLPLFLRKDQFYWKLALDGSNNGTCNESATVAATDTTDNSHLIMIGILGLIFVIIIIIILPMGCCCYYRKKIRNKSSTDTYSMKKVELTCISAIG
ncbi:uncharacterized protein [Haliotis cracherodii]|uniref:uncharacterized protein n=1 Tax=Haliotis cracherodii TaxID=6455 RepID=UPI0039E98657